jgi:hypothetical protein
MNTSTDTPRAAEELWAFNFFRTYSDCIVTTYNNVRRAPYYFDEGFTINPHEFDPKVFYN